MELSQEVYSIIVRHVGARSDLNSLCRVSKRFRREAEKALYNTLHLRGQARSVSICNVLNHTPRLALLVEALSVFVEGGDSEEDDEEDDSDIDMGSESSYSDDFWTTVASALRQTTKLRFLSVYLERVGQSQHAWILDGCTFQLRTFHSDFDWDHHLETFLRSQTTLHDLYLADYMTPGCPASSRTPFYNTSPPLPSLSMLECTLSEAAVALVPGRPVERVKTCFSKTKLEDKRAELRALLLGLRRSKKPLRTLDLADDVYQSSFTLELVAAIDRILAGKHKLRYLGTLVYPVDPSEVSVKSLSNKIGPEFESLLSARRILHWSHALAPLAMCGARSHRMGPSTNDASRAAGSHLRAPYILPESRSGSVCLRL